MAALEKSNELAPENVSAPEILNVVPNNVIAPLPRPLNTVPFNAKLPNPNCTGDALFKVIIAAADPPLSVNVEPDATLTAITLPHPLKSKLPAVKLLLRFSVAVKLDGTIWSNSMLVDDPDIGTPGGVTQLAGSLQLPVLCATHV
jgi:hypothetical protein